MRAQRHGTELPKGTVHAAMGRQVWITRDGDGKIVGSTEVRTASGCGGCLWALLGIFVVFAPAAWAGDGTIPVAVAVVMYLVEAALLIAWLLQRRPRQT